MSILSPFELGRLVGLSSTGEPAPIASRPAGQVLGDADRVLQKVAANLTTGQHHAYKLEFNSLYLISLVRSVLLPGPTPVPAMVQNLVLWATPEVPRLVREYPDLSISLYQKSASHLADSAKHVENDSEMERLAPGMAAALRRILWEWVTHLTLLYMTLDTHLPADAVLPPVPEGIRSQVRRLTDLIRQSPALFSTPGSEVFLASLSVLILIGRQTGERDWQSRQPARLERTRPLIWLDCDYGAQDSADDPCLKFEDGEEMMACGRCLAVRYCSKEHQKSDWKRHKLYCFKPTW